MNYWYTIIIEMLLAIAFSWLQPEELSLCRALLLAILKKVLVTALVALCRKWFVAEACEPKEPPHFCDCPYPPEHLTPSSTHDYRTPNSETQPAHLSMRGGQEK